jgi:hypothetical protein
MRITYEMSTKTRNKHGVAAIDRDEMTTIASFQLLTSATLAPRRAASVRNVSLCILGEAVRAEAMAAQALVIFSRFNVTFGSCVCV